MTKNQWVRLVSRIYLVTLGILSAWFLGALAMADPKCANCSINLVLWAMPRAEILTGAWIVAGSGYSWSIRHNIAAFFYTAWRTVRQTGMTGRSRQNEA